MSDDTGGDADDTGGDTDDTGGDTGDAGAPSWPVSPEPAVTGSSAPLPPPPPPAPLPQPPPPGPPQSSMPPPPAPQPQFAQSQLAGPGQWSAPPPPMPVAAPTWRSLSGVTTALTVFLWLVAAASVFGIVAFVSRINALSDFIDGPFDFDTVQRVHDADDLVGAATALLVFLTFVVFVLIIVWMFRAAKNNDALGRLYPRLKPGWAIAGWLIPLANLVLPVLMLQDLWRGSEPSTPRGDPAWRSNRGSALIGWYWGVFIVSSARFGFGRARARFSVPDELRDLRTHDTIAVFGLVVSIAAAILAIQVVRRIAARQEECLRAQQAAWGSGS